MSTILNLNSRSKKSIAKTNGTSAGLSSSINEKLEVVVRMAHRNAMIRGTAYVVALVLASILMYLAIDALFSIESQWIRGIMLLVLAILGTGSCWLFILRSRPTKNDLLNAAWKIEDQCPELEERLLSTVQLLGNDAAKCAGSEQLIDALANEAAAGLEQVDPGEMKDHSTIYPVSIATALMCTALLIVLIWPGTVLSSLGNLVMPWRIPPVAPLQVHIEPGSVSIVKGQPISITAKFDEPVDQPVLELFDQNRHVIRQTPMKVVDNASTVAFDDLQQSVDYRVRAGKKTSPIFSIKVLTKPVIESVECKLEFPAYTNLGTATIKQVAEPITVPVGTKIKLSVPTPNGSIRGYLKLGDQKKILSLNDNFDVNQTRQSTCNWEFLVQDKMDSVALLQLESEEGVTSDPFRIEITAIGDSAPEIKILSPGIRHLTLARDVELPVGYSITDDFGVSGVELVTQIVGQKENVTPCPDVTHDTENPGTYLGRTAIALSEFESEVQSVKFWIRARDNRDDENGGPQMVESEKTTVVFEQSAASFGKQQIDTEFEIARQAIEDSIAQLQLAKQQAELLESKLADSNEAADFAESKKLRDDTKLARETLLEQAKQVEQNTDLFKPVADQMKDIAEQEATRADIEANQIPLTDDPNTQQSHAEKTSEETDSAIEKLNDLNSRIEDQKRDMELAAELDELARKQEKLADDAKRRNGEDPKDADAKSDQWKKEQEKLAEQIQNQVDQDPAAKREQILAHAEQAQRLADEAEQLAQQQQQLADMPANDEGQPHERKQLEKQLSEMLAKEQEAIKEQTKELRDKNANNGTNEKQLDRLQNAEKSMDDVINKLKQPNQDQTAKQDENDRQQEGDDANQQNENNLKEAAKNARMAAEKLQQRPDKKAQQANQAGKETDEKPNQNQPGKPDPAPANNEDGERQEEIAEQQKNVADALEALDNGDVEKAAAKLQKQIADRAKQLKRDAEKLEQKNEPNEQIKDQKRDALEKIKQAEQAANDADQQLNGKKENNAQNQEKPNQEKQNKGDANNQPGENQQNKNEQADEKASDQNQNGQQPGSQAKPNSNNGGNQQKQSGENKQINDADKKPTKGGEEKQNSKQGDSQQDEQNQQQGQSNKGQQRQKNDDGQPENQKQNSDQGQNKNQAQNKSQQQNGNQQQNSNNGQKDNQGKPGSKKPGKDEKQGQQGAKQAQKQTAQSLREASKSLQQVCQQCRQCKECQNPSGGDSSGAGKSKNGDASKTNKQATESSKNQSSDKQNEGQQRKPKTGNGKDGQKTSDKGAQSSKPDNQPGTAKKDSPGEKNGAKSPANEQDSAEKSLAKAADKSNEASKSQTDKQASESAEQAAKELNKAADQAAQKSGYKLRNAGQCNGQCENPGNSPGQSSNGKQPGESQKKSDKPSNGSKPGSSPKGVENKGSNPELDGATLRGGSSSNWTRGRKQQKGGVLDDRSGNVPEEYRGLVEDYFKELARRGKDNDKSKTDKNE